MDLPILIKCRIFSFIWSQGFCQEKSGPEFQFLIKSNSLKATVQRFRVQRFRVERWHWIP
jgi:hypothetical protein